MLERELAGSWKCAVRAKVTQLIHALPQGGGAGAWLCKQGCSIWHGRVPAPQQPLPSGNNLCWALLGAIKSRRESVSEERRETLCVSLWESAMAPTPINK